MTEQERIIQLESVVAEQAERINTLINTSRLAKINFELRHDVLDVCEERDRAYRKIEQLEKQIKLMGG
jgi:hypothetical protein